MASKKKLLPDILLQWKGELHRQAEYPEEGFDPYDPYPYQRDLSG